MVQLQASEFLETTKNLLKTLEKDRSINSFNKINPSLPTSDGFACGKKVTILRDTGCDTVVVRNTLVPIERITEKKKECQLADTIVIEAPIAIITLESPFYCGEIEAVCLPNPSHDLIIGNIEGVKCACTINGFNNDGSSQRFNSIEAEQEFHAVSNNPEIFYGKMKITRNELIVLQREDMSLQKYRELTNLNTQEDCKMPTFHYKNELLLRRKNDDEQIVLPKSLRLHVIKIRHEGVMAGHLGIRKTTARITKHFYWPGCLSEIKNICRTYHECKI